MIRLDPIDREIAEFYNEHLRTRGYAPTLREICKKVGLKAPSTISTRLQRLEAAGMIAGYRRKQVQS